MAMSDRFSLAEAGSVTTAAIPEHRAAAAALRSRAMESREIPAVAGCAAEPSAGACH